MNCKPLKIYNKSNFSLIILTNKFNKITLNVFGLLKRINLMTST